MEKFKNLTKRKKLLLLIILICLGVFFIGQVDAKNTINNSYETISNSEWNSNNESKNGSSWRDDSGTVYTTQYGSKVSLFEIIIISIAIIIIIIALNVIQKINEYGDAFFKKRSLYEDINEDKVKAILPSSSLKLLKNEMFERFVNIQNALSVFDYDKLQTLCTEEIYNGYVSQAEVLKVKNSKNIMNDFSMLQAKVISINENINSIDITLYMTISFYDYVIDTTNNNIISGSDKSKVVNRYIMTFTKNKNVVLKEYCSNCGAPVANSNASICEYCDSVVNNSSNEFVLSKKMNVNK